MKDAEREIRAAGIDFREVLMTLYAGVQAARSIDDPTGPPLADLLEVIGNGVSDLILALSDAGGVA